MKHVTNLTLLLATTYLAFQNGNGWKKDENGALMLDGNGNPIWIDANGGEQAVQGDTISRLHGEAKNLRIRAETAETKAKSFEGLDAEKARDALDKLSKIDQKQLIDSGEVDKVRKEISDQYTEKLTEKDKALAAATSRIDNMTIDNIFNGSDFIRDNVAVPADMFQATFRNNFKVEDGKVVAYDKAGNRVMSAKNMGDYADPSEAIEILINSHPQKDLILKANTGNGSGNNGNGGNRGGNARRMSRADFDAAPPTKQAEIAAQMGKGEITIVD